MRFPGNHVWPFSLVPHTRVAVLVPLVLIDWYFNDLGFLKAMWRNWMFALTLIEQLLSDVVSGRFP